MERPQPEQVVEDIWPLTADDLEEGMDAVTWKDPYETREGRIAEAELEEPVQYHAGRVGADRILEVGASSGFTTEELAGLLPSTTVTGVELCGDRVREAEQRRRSDGYRGHADRWEVVQGRATELSSVVAGEYDMVVGLNSLGTLVDTGVIGQAAVSRAREMGYGIPEGSGNIADRLRSAAEYRYIADVLGSVSDVTESEAPLLLAEGCAYLVAEQRDGDWYAVESRDAVLERRQSGGTVQLGNQFTVEGHKLVDEVYSSWLDHMDTSERSRRTPVQRGA